MVIECHFLIRSAKVAAQHLRHVDTAIQRDWKNFLPRPQGYKSLHEFPSVPQTPTERTVGS